jgi:zinc and cadmium transporter
MSPLVVLVVYSVLVVIASLVGGALPSFVRLTHARLQLGLSCVGGFMLGVSLLHLVPHSAAQTGSLDVSLRWTVAGLLAMFFLIRIFHFHEHGTAADEHPPQEPCEHDHAHAEHHEHPGIHRLSWMGVAFGLGVHTLIDGVTMAAAVMAEAAHGGEGHYPHGLGVFLAILLHKPLDALSVTSLMAAAGWSARTRAVVNASFALMCPAGAALAALGLHKLGGEQQFALGCVLGFAGGAFLCISLGDLLPELQFHRHDPWRLSAALLLGVALAWAIGLFEPEHVHESPQHRHHHDHEH